jgi:hypothetical protein
MLLLPCGKNTSPSTLGGKSQAQLSVLGFGTLKFAIMHL